MFKGIQDVMSKVTTKETASSDPHLLPLQTPEKILNLNRRVELLSQFQNQMSISQENYEKLCMPLIQNVAALVQELPETRGGQFSEHGGIIDHCLSRANIALTLVRAYFLPSGEDDQPLTQPQTLWAYAAFSASLLQGIGKIAVDLRVEMIDRLHKNIGIWSPFDGPMSTAATHYRYDFDTNYPDSFRQRATLLLGRQLMPGEGFAWIASNKDLFHIWLSLLDDDSEGGRTLGPILLRADALAIAQNIDNTDPPHRERSKFALDAETPRTQPLDAGKAFLNWLRDQVDMNKINLDGDIVVHVAEGVMVTQEAFKVFVRENPNFKNWQAVQTAFTGLGIHRLGSGNEIFQRYARLNSKSYLDGMIINKELVIPAKLSLRQPSKDVVRMPVAQPDPNKFIAGNGQLVKEMPATFSPIGPNYRSM